MLLQRTDTSPVSNASSIIIVVLVLLIGATAYLRHQGYVGRNGSGLAIALFALLLVAVGAWMYWFAK